MAVRVFGIIILAITSIYAFDVVLPAHAYGVYHFSDFRVKGFYDVPPGWNGIHPSILLFPILFLSTAFAMFPGGLKVLIGFLSFGLIFRLISDRRSYSLKEKSFWLLVLLGSWIFFYVNSEIIEMYRIWLLD